MKSSTVKYPDLSGAKKYALDRLTHKLPPDLCYHSLWHTEHEVVQQALYLASKENLGELHIILIHTAALYHDIGFISTRIEHESVSTQIAAAVLPKFGYNQEQIHLIECMIMATRLPQKPHNLLEEILADADLDLLGRTDYLARNSMLRNEIELEGHTFSDEIWFRNQIQFLLSHRFFTEGARKLRSAQKKQNIKTLNKICENIQSYKSSTTGNNLQGPFLQYTPL